MTKKIIVLNETDKSMLEALYYVKQVMANRNNKEAIGDSTITTFIDGTAVSYMKNQKSATYVVCYEQTLVKRSVNGGGKDENDNV